MSENNFRIIIEKVWGEMCWKLKWSMGRRSGLEVSHKKDSIKSQQNNNSKDWSARGFDKLAIRKRDLKKGTIATAILAILTLGILGS